jgi:adenylate cyclase
VLAVLPPTGGAAPYRVLTEDRARRQLRHVFSRYLADDVINILIQDPERVDLEGAEIEGTVLFTDLQGFTTFAEERSPKEVIGILNRYFDTLTSIILDAGGLVDKYTGDGVMAVFGAPLPREDHARLACEAVLAMRERNINGLIPAPGGDIITRVGVSSGPMIVGNLGTERKMDYTAVGDTVNLSARLEGVNKTYGTINMFSEFTVRPVIREYLFREVDIIRVKGKRRPIRVYTLLGRMGSFSPWQMETEDLFQDGRELYGRRDWSGAEQVFAEVLRRNPQDGPAHAFLVRCRHLQRHPELVDEQGVFTFTVK